MIKWCNAMEPTLDLLGTLGHEVALEAEEHGELGGHRVRHPLVDVHGHLGVVVKMEVVVKVVVMVMVLVVAVVVVVVVVVVVLVILLLMMTKVV